MSADSSVRFGGTKPVRVIVRYRNEKWEMLDGSRLPVKDGVLAELHLNERSISDLELLRRLKERLVVRVLGEGTELRVALTIRSDLPKESKKRLIGRSRFTWDQTSNISVDSEFVRIHLSRPTWKQLARQETMGGLWLHLTGQEAVLLESSEVKLPKVAGLDRAISLNHAFTLLSERFEPWRKTHTGNVYERVFYRDSDKIWYPLGDFRDRAKASAKRRILRRLYADIDERFAESSCSEPRRKTMHELDDELSGL